MSQNHRGMTLIELLMVIALLTVLLSVGVPGLYGYLEKSRLRSLAETLTTTLYYARSEAIAQPGAEVYVHFKVDDDNPASWCFGLSRASTCDCWLNDTSNANTCYLEINGEELLQVTRASDFPGILMPVDQMAFSGSSGGSQKISFDPVRGITPSAGHVTFKQHQALKVVLSPLGRARICSPASAYLHGYPEC